MAGESRVVDRGSQIMFDSLDEVFTTCYEEENCYEMV